MAASASESSTLDSSPIQAALLVLLAFAVYGRHLTDGPLADDFLYLHWASRGLGEVVARMTVESNPQIIRPLPALVWWLGTRFGSLVGLHALQIALHGLSGWGVSCLARTRGARPTVALALGGVFVTLPIFGEPVLWLSSLSDPLATAFSLGAIVTWLSAESGRFGTIRPGLVLSTALLFLALLSKESSLLVALLPLALLRTHRSQFVWFWSLTLSLYLGFRLLLFGGLGGYLSADGSTQALAIDPLRFLRNALLQWPARVLSGIKRPWESIELSIALAWVALLLIGLLLSSARIGSWRNLAGPVALLLLLLLPAAAAFSVDSDHENSRLLYLPLAVALGFSGHLWAERSKLTAVAVPLILVWAAVAALNARDWARASDEVERTRKALLQIEAHFSAGDTILVDGSDVQRGAYVLRNGLGVATSTRWGLRPDREWRHGTVGSMQSSAGRLGNDLFVVQVLPTGQVWDRTPCELALRSAQPISTSLRPRGTGLFEIQPSEPVGGLRIERPPSSSSGSGRLSWRLAEPAFTRFTLTDSKPFVFGPESNRVEIPLTLGTQEAWWIRIDDLSPTDLDVRVIGLRRPKECLAGGPRQRPGVETGRESRSGG